MALPQELRQAASSLEGGKIALVLGAGCSVEVPTGIPLASQCSRDLHRQLVADGVLQEGDCADLSDLSLLADAVFARTNSQCAVVDRFREQFDLKLATPNEGYLIAAALLCERVISSVVALNFDLALSAALMALGTVPVVGLVEGPEDLPNQRTVNVYYLHRNANADPESWVLRTAAMAKGLGATLGVHHCREGVDSASCRICGPCTPVAVVIGTAKLICTALPSTTKFFQVDPIEKEQSRFFKELEIGAPSYIQSGWGMFMVELSARFVEELAARLEKAIEQKTSLDGTPTEDVTVILARFRDLGIVKLGKLRSHWLLHDKPYRPVESEDAGLMADLVLALGMIARVSNVSVFLLEDGAVEFARDGRVIATFLVASGRGHRSKAGVEAAVESRSWQRGNRTPALGVLVGGTSDLWTSETTPPRDVVRGNTIDDDLVTGATTPPMVHIAELRAHPALISQVFQ